MGDEENPGVGLNKIRWSRASEAERKAVGKMLSAARARARRKRLVKERAKLKKAKASKS